MVLRIVDFACIRCGTRYPVSHYARDCDTCRPVAPSNLAAVYAGGKGDLASKPGAGIPFDLWRYGDVLPVSRADAVSLGEGGTPLLPLSRIGAGLGLARLYVKDEARNPTASFKDRLACIAVSAARALGCGTIVSSSSGNAGAAVAAYAAKAGLRCVIFTLKGASGPMMAQMRAYGAEVVAVTNKADRWTLMSEAVRTYGWFPTSPYFAPAVGSNPFGIEGYRTLAYEMAEALAWQVPDWIVVPVCYGDALLGIWRGFSDMQRAGWTQRMPKLVAAEVYGSLEEAMRTGNDQLPDMPKTHETVATSITATQATYQSLKVLRESGGCAVTLSNADLLRWQRRLASQEGLFVEASSAGALVAIERLVRDGTMSGSDVVVALNTASGLKAPGALDHELPAPVEVPADLARAAAILKERGIFA